MSYYSSNTYDGASDWSRTHASSQANASAGNSSWSQYHQQPVSHHTSTSQQAYSAQAWQEARSKSTFGQNPDQSGPTPAEVNHLIRNLQVPGSAALQSSGSSVSPLQQKGHVGTIVLQRRCCPSARSSWQSTRAHKAVHIGVAARERLGKVFGYHSHSHTSTRCPMTTRPSHKIRRWSQCIDMRSAAPAH